MRSFRTAPIDLPIYRRSAQIAVRLYVTATTPMALNVAAFPRRHNIEHPLPSPTKTTPGPDAGRPLCMLVRAFREAFHRRNVPAFRLQVKRFTGRVGARRRRRVT